MDWTTVRPRRLYARGDYELERWDRGSSSGIWAVCFRGRQIGRFRSLADAKWWADDHRQVWHETELERSGNALVGGAL